jgi:hypothetical protein
VPIHPLAEVQVRQPELPTHLQVIVGVKAKNRFRKLIRITGTRFTRKRRNDNWMSGPHFDLGHVLESLVRLGVALSPAVIKPRLTAGIDPTHHLFLGSSLENLFPRECLQAWPTKLGHEVPSGQSVLVLIGSHEQYLEYRSYKLNMCLWELSASRRPRSLWPNYSRDVRL